MNKTVIVTDSTADIPADLAKQHNIHIVPLRLMFGKIRIWTESKLPPRVLQKLVQSPQLPTTSQPSPADFVAVYESILEQQPGRSIVSIHISSGLSGTYQSALLATSLIEGEADITVWDSKSASYGFDYSWFMQRSSHKQVRLFQILFRRLRISLQAPSLLPGRHAGVFAEGWANWQGFGCTWNPA